MFFSFSDMFVYFNERCEFFLSKYAQKKSFSRLSSQKIVAFINLTEQKENVLKTFLKHSNIFKIE